jgi:hypothetical protein
MSNGGQPRTTLLWIAIVVLLVLQGITFWWARGKHATVERWAGVTDTWADTTTNWVTGAWQLWLSRGRIEPNCVVLETTRDIVVDGVTIKGREIKCTRGTYAHSDPTDPPPTKPCSFGTCP